MKDSVPTSLAINDEQRRFKERDAASYEALTESFDRFALRFTLPLARRLVDRAEVRAGQRILDVGTGTGIVGLQAARETGPPGRVVAVDLSDEMLRAGRANARSGGLADRMHFHRADAERLGLRDASFDAVLSLFALLHLPAPEDALSEMFRVLRPGGRLVCGIGTPPPRLSLPGIACVLRGIPIAIEAASRRCLTSPGFLHEMVERHLPGDRRSEESALARSGSRASRALVSMVAKAGFSHVKFGWDGYVARIDTPEEFWELGATLSSRARKRLESASKEQVAELRKRFFARCREVRARGGRLIYPHGAFFITGCRPRTRREL